MLKGTRCLLSQAQACWGAPAGLAARLGPAARVAPAALAVLSPGLVEKVLKAVHNPAKSLSAVKATLSSPSSSGVAWFLRLETTPVALSACPHEKQGRSVGLGSCGQVEAQALSIPLSLAEQ